MPKTTEDPTPDTPAPEPDPEPAKAGPAWKGSLSSSKPLVAPDGHVTLSQEDIDARS